jgi:large subunit ribosomal protein L6
MSRIGVKPITVPAGVEVTIAEGNFVTVKGPKGTLTKQLDGALKIKQEENTITVERPTNNKQHRSLHGLTRTLIDNMVVARPSGLRIRRAEVRIKGPRVPDIRKISENQKCSFKD